MPFRTKSQNSSFNLWDSEACSELKDKVVETEKRWKIEIRRFVARSPSLKATARTQLATLAWIPSGDISRKTTRQ